MQKRRYRAFVELSTNFQFEQPIETQVMSIYQLNLTVAHMLYVHLYNKCTNFLDILARKS